MHNHALHLCAQIPRLLSGDASLHEMPRPDPRARISRAYPLDLFTRRHGGTPVRYAMASRSVEAETCEEMASSEGKRIGMELMVATLASVVVVRQ